MAEPVSKVPFSRAEELTIISMARWMRFMAVVGIVGAGLILLILVVALGAYAMASGATSPAGWARLQSFIEANTLLVYGLIGAFLFAVGIGFWQNVTLYHAGDDFDLVARTDQADVDYLAQGLDKLRVFFKVQVLALFVMMALALVAGLVAYALLRHA